MKWRREERRGGKERCKPVESGKGLGARGREGETEGGGGGGQEGKGKGRIEENARSSRRRRHRRRRQRRTRGSGERRRGRTTDGRTCGLAGWAGEGRGREGGAAAVVAVVVVRRPYTAIQLTSGGATTPSVARWAAIPAKQSDSHSLFTRLCGRRRRRRRRRLFPLALCARSSLAEPILSPLLQSEGVRRPRSDRQSSQEEEGNGGNDRDFKMRGAKERRVAARK